jgi:hypothetical protein
MTKNVFFTLIAFSIIASCKRETVKETRYGQEIRLEVKTRSVGINENTLQDYYLLSSFKEGNIEVLAGYNDKIHGLDFIQIENGDILNIPLDKEGENAVPLGVSGLFVHRKDSIWIYNNGKIYLLDNLGNVRKTIPTQMNEAPIVDTNFSTASVKLYYNGKRRSLFYASKLFVYEHFIEHDSIAKYRLLESPFLKGKEESAYGWKQIPNITYTDATIIYNYPIASDIYTIDLMTQEESLFGGESRYTSNLSNQLRSGFTFENAERHKVENIHFFEVMYNKRYNVYYRLHLGENTDMDEQNLFESYNRKRMYLMVFDQNFRVISEVDLGVGQYSYMNSWISIDEGLLLFKKEQDMHENDDYIELVIFYPCIGPT